jgi:plasmid stability protein
MPVNLSIKNAPEKLVRKLKKRAERNHRSLQGELMAIITEAVERPQPMTFKELVERGRRLGLTSPAEAADIVRADRDSR